MSQVTYTPPPSLIPFLTSEKLIALVIGPVGSLKTTAAIMKIAYHAAKMAACSDGVRRSRAVWVRNTRQMLMDTSIPDFLKWFPEGLAGAYLRTEMKFLLKFGDVECEILFRGLDDGNDVRRLLSLQASFAIFDEFREVNPDIFSTMLGRLGRYPDKMLVPPRPEWGVDARGDPIGGCVTDAGVINRHVWGASNPPDIDSYWEQYISDPPENADCFIQPGAMTPEADWLQYLPSGYYEELMKANSAEWVDVYVHAKFGKSLSGRAVFRSFDPTYHVSRTPLTPIISENLPLIIGLDLGLTPACTISQQDLRGRFNTFAELTSDGMGITRFSRELLKPLLTTKFPGHPVVIICDPAGTQRAQTDERSVVDVLKAEGFTIHPARTNNISARVSAVESLLSQQIDGKPRHLIDSSCRRLIQALHSGYRYKIRANGETEDKPEKNFASHIAEAHQYAALHVDQVFGGAYTLRRQRRDVAPANRLGWT
jgi:hypothetical protein